MATTQSQSFRGGAISPGSGVSEDDIQDLNVAHTTSAGTPALETYSPLNGATFSFGRVTFKKSGNRVIGSYDPFDSNKNITVVTMDAVEFSESTLTISDSDYALIEADYDSGNPVVLISENGGSDVVWQLALKSSAGYTFTSTTQTSVRVANVSSASGHAVTITTADFVPATGVTPGTYTKVTVNAKGTVTNGGSLVATDIPNLPASILTSGTLDPARIGDASIEPIKLKYKKELAVDGRTIGANETANTITLYVPEKLQPITRHAIYSVTDATPRNVDIIDGEFEDISYNYQGTGTINLTTNVTTDCHAIMYIEPQLGSCGYCNVVYTDEAMNQRTLELDATISGGYLLTIDIRKVTYNNTPYSIAKVSYVRAV